LGRFCNSGYQESQRNERREQEMTVTLKLCGSGNFPIYHMSYFGEYGAFYRENSVGKKYWEDQLKEIASCIDTADREGKAIQITLTDRQLSADPYQRVFEDLGFVLVYKHINPNTLRTIHTFMRKPDTSLFKGEKKSILAKTYLSSAYERGNYDSECFRGLVSNSQVINYHGGGCCGWNSVWGFNPYSYEEAVVYKGSSSYNQNFLWEISKIIGSIALIRKSLAFQLFIPSTALRVEDEYSGSDCGKFLKECGFEKVWNFTDQSSTLNFVMLVKCDYKIDIK
jgi:hypothetical protein